MSKGNKGKGYIRTLNPNSKQKPKPNGEPVDVSSTSSGLFRALPIKKKKPTGIS